MNKQFSHIDPSEIITRILAGEASVEEKSYIEDWKLQQAENTRLYSELAQIWDGMVDIDTGLGIDVNKEWNRFSAALAEQKEAGKVPSRSIPLPNLRVTVMRYAAVVLVMILLGVGGYYIYEQSQYKTMVALNQTVENELPDGTVVTLNSHSEVKFPKEFKEKKRTVKLKGEAYFDVKPDEGHPFVINTDEVVIEVLGTKFYVNAIPGTDSVEVIVSEGSVAVTSRKTSDKVILAAGEKAIFNKNRMQLQKSANTDVNFIAWKTGRLEFDEVKLSQIVAKINKVYNTHIDMDEHIGKCRMTVTFNNQPLESVLTIIEATHDLRVTDKGNNTYYLSGDGC